MDRIRAWLDPWKYADTIGYHTVQGLLALGLGGVFGSGLGESRMAGGLFVPNAFNDFIFAIIGEEFGLIGAGVVIALFVLLAYAGIRVALGAPDTFGALLAAGITAWLCIQAFINIGVVVTLVPITGITLPFISAGGSSLIISFAAIGILLSISRETIEKGTWNDDATADRGAAERAGTSTRLWPSPGRCARGTTALSSAGWAVIAGSRPASSRRPASRSAGWSCARCDRSRSTRTRSSTRCGSAHRSRRPRAILAARAPDAIFTTGGYVAVPVLLAAAPLGIPVVLWDGNVVPGRAVRATARLADVIAVSFARDVPGARDRGARAPVLPDRHADP